MNATDTTDAPTLALRQYRYSPIRMVIFSALLSQMDLAGGTVATRRAKGRSRQCPFVARSTLGPPIRMTKNRYVDVRL
jgi:hypothetical protein